jgi:toxin ParE1/3/4
MILYRLANQAIDDLEDIWDFLGFEKENPRAAERQIEILHQKFSILGENPLLGEACDRLRPGMRFFTAGKYVIFYVPLSRGIEIERIIYGTRDIEAIFQ